MIIGYQFTKSGASWWVRIIGGPFRDKKWYRDQCWEVKDTDGVVFNQGRGYVSVKKGSLNLESIMGYDCYIPFGYSTPGVHLSKSF